MKCKYPAEGLCGILQNKEGGREGEDERVGGGRGEGLCASTAKVIEKQSLFCSRCEKWQGQFQLHGHSIR